VPDSSVAQRKRVGLITQRSEDRNLVELESNSFVFAADGPNVRRSCHLFFQESHDDASRFLA
jgi:hypothetical protein